MTPGAKFSISTSARRDHLDQQVAPLRVLQVERDGALVGVEHREGQRRAADHAAPAQVLAALRLDLDHVGAGLRHQERRVGPVVDLREIDNGDAVERIGRAIVSAP